MEPDVIRMYSSSPPPMEDGAEEDDEEFGVFSGVPNSISFTEFDAAATFNQSQTLAATSPPELLNRGGLSEHGGSAKANGVVRGPGDGDAAGRTVSAEELKQLAEHAQPSTAHTDSKLMGGRERTDAVSVECNGSPDDSSRLTNGFAAFDEQGSPSFDAHAPAGKSTGSDAAATDGFPTFNAIDNEDDFADFAAFSNTNTNTDTNSHTHSNDLTDQKVNWGNPFVAEWQTENVLHPSPGTVGLEANGGEFRDSCAPGIDHQPSGSIGTSEGLNNGDGGSVHSWPDTDTTQRDTEPDGSLSADTQCAAQTKITLNGEVQGGSEDESFKAPPSTQCADERSREKRDSGSGNDSEPETETETSLGRPLSTDALEEFGDFSTTGSVPSPPLQEETATPADHSQMVEDGEEEEFGDFGDFSSTSGGFGSGQEFSGFSSPQKVDVADVGTADATHKGCKEESTSHTEEVSSVSSRDPDPDPESEHKAHSHQRSEEDHGNLPVSDSFADFHSAPVGGETSGGNDEWTAFDEQPEDKDTAAAAQGESWASFGPQETTALSTEEASEGEWQESPPQPPLTAPLSSGNSSSDSSRTDGTTVSVFVV